MGSILSIINFNQSTGACDILNNTNLTRNFYAQVLVGEYPSGAATRVWNLSDSVASNDEYAIYPSGMTAGNVYTLYIYYNYPSNPSPQDSRVIKFGSGSGGQGGSAGGAGDLGEKITTVSWNSSNWGSATTFWAEEHGTGAFNDYGGRYDDPGYAVVPGYSIPKGWVSPSQTYDKYQGTLYAKSTSGAAMSAATVTDSEVTINFTTKARSRLYANFPWHGMRVIYQDDSGVERIYVDNPTSTSGLTNSNSSWSGTITDAYWCPLTTNWANVPVEITYTRELSAKTRTIKVQLYGDVGGYISTSDGTKEFRTFVSTLLINVTIPAISGYRVSVDSDINGNAVVTDGTVTDTSVVVNNGSSVTCTATAEEGYIFTGWYSEGSLVSTNNPYTFNVSSNIDLIAQFEEDTSSKATHLYEPVTNKTYQLADGSLARVDNVTITTDRIARWRSSSDKIASGYILTYASTLPAVSNGSIYAVNSESNRPAETYPNETSWTYGSSADYGGGDLIRAAMKVVYQSETPTTLTIRVYCTLSQNAAYLNNNSCNIHWTYTENGVDMTPYNGNTNLSSSDFKYTNYTSTTGWSAYFTATNTWCDLIDNVNNASAARPATSSSTPCNWYKDVVIPKTNSVQSFVFKTTVGSGYSSETSSVTKTITIPAAGYKACVDHGGSHKAGQPYVLYNGSWKQATMYVFDGTQWVKSHYY